MKPDQDEEGVTAAEIEPVAAQQAKPEAGMRDGCLAKKIKKKKTKYIFLDLIMVAVS